ncbi:hypothetical protein LSTR_LSTR015979 [Laodelphax striatellus]|uniref:RNA-directed DNA polymerase n=1 Tax=Laodelphax striatellus TaxID=195883 RepID=A0A482XL56_LAOST|nr:hypothetical protein LSTR_LSTR015979 [Laodelphax striatellus]
MKELAFGIKKTYHALKENCYFKNMGRKVAKILRACDICQKTKHNRFTIRGKMMPILPKSPLELVSADIYGPLPTAKHAKKYIFALTCVFSKYTMLFSVGKITGDKLASYITDNWTNKVGKPQRILSDNATYFCSAKWREKLLQAGIKLSRTSTYTPSSNPVERKMAEISRFMRAYCHKSHQQWAQYLPFLEYCLNNSYRKVLVSPHIK